MILRCHKTNPLYDEQRISMNFLGSLHMHFMATGRRFKVSEGLLGSSLTIAGTFIAIGYTPYTYDVG